MAIYRMYSGGAAAGENVVDLIRQSLVEQGNKMSNLKLDFIGFEADEGTEFNLNNFEDSMKVPSCGNFVTPYNGTEYMTITSLVFKENFEGDIYYIY